MKEGEIPRFGPFIFCFFLSVFICGFKQCLSPAAICGYPGWLLLGELFVLFVRWRLGIGYNEMYFRN